MRSGTLADPPGVVRSFVFCVGSAPRVFKPMLGMLGPRHRDGDWSFEPKWYGVRELCIDDGSVVVRSLPDTDECPQPTSGRLTTKPAANARQWRS